MKGCLPELDHGDRGKPRQVLLDVRTVTDEQVPLIAAALDRAARDA